MLPADFQAAKPAPSLRDLGAISTRRPARWDGTACCSDSERDPQFPSSQSSKSHAQNTTPRVIRQAAEILQPMGSCSLGRSPDAIRPPRFTRDSATARTVDAGNRRSDRHLFGCSQGTDVPRQGRASQIIAHETAAATSICQRMRALPAERWLAQSGYTNTLRRSTGSTRAVKS
jgi:hypothetical protein